jgi:3-dehydroquinate synthase
MLNLEVKISAKEEAYPIYIEQDKIENLKSKIAKHLRGNKVLVVISEKVEKLYGKLLGFSKEEKFVLKDGEKEKNFNNYKKILEKAFEMKLTRKDAIIAIGGGVAGDIAGFAAATYMRGIDYIQVPTTLLACVDSSVGGKTAIDTSFGKNLIGSFYQPKAVFINLNFLKTLDERQYKTGLGEVVKYIFIEKSCFCKEELNFSNFINENTEKILSRNLNTLEILIESCIKLKIAVVEQDEKELGLRKILNFGHTLGHAIEKITNYKKYTHGEAVVEGIRFAFKLAEKRGLIDKNYRFFADDILKKFYFRQITKLPENKLLEAMKMDKKSADGKIIFILPIDYSIVKEVSLNSDEIF